MGRLKIPKQDQSPMLFKVKEMLPLSTLTCKTAEKFTTAMRRAASKPERLFSRGRRPRNLHGCTHQGSTSEPGVRGGTTSAKEISKTAVR